MTDPAVTPDPMDEAAVIVDHNMPWAEPTVWLSDAKRIRDEAVTAERVRILALVGQLRASVESVKDPSDRERLAYRVGRDQSFRDVLAALDSASPVEQATCEPTKETDQP